MTEQQWLQATAPRGGLDHLCSPQVNAHRRKAGRRKLRLFLCACARRIWDLIPEDPYREAVELGERLCEGKHAEARVDSIHDRIKTLVRGVSLAKAHASHTALACIGTNIWHAVVTGTEAAGRAVGWGRVEASRSENMQLYDLGDKAERLAQVPLLHDVFGNPFRPVKLSAVWLRWNDGTLPAMARSIYEEKAFDRLPILADALMDAGCDNEEILAHCHSEGPHVRGCWVVDLLLGKECGKDALPEPHLRTK